MEVGWLIVRDPILKLNRQKKLLYPRAVKGEERGVALQAMYQSIMVEVHNWSSITSISKFLEEKNIHAREKTTTYNRSSR